MKWGLPTGREREAAGPSPRPLLSPVQKGDSSEALEGTSTQTTPMSDHPACLLAGPLSLASLGRRHLLVAPLPGARGGAYEGRRPRDPPPRSLRAAPSARAPAAKPPPSLPAPLPFLPLSVWKTSCCCAPFAPPLPRHARQDVTPTGRRRCDRGRHLPDARLRGRGRRKRRK